MARGRLYVAGRNVLVPLGGFVTGWLAYRVFEEKELIGEEYLRWIRLCNLNMRLYLQQHIFPAEFSAKYCYPEEFLKTMIDRLNTSDDNAGAEKWTFERVLQECSVSEQIAWLEEHATYDIPYFYIADLFNGWCSLHRHRFLSANVATKEGCGEPCKSGSDAFTSEVLCNAVVVKMMNEVLPFDVAVRTLCILAVGHRANAQQLSKLISPQLILERYEAYLDGLEQRSKQSGDVVPSFEVAAATLELLRALNAASTRWWQLPFWGRASKRDYPAVTELDGERWCRCFGELPSRVATGCTDGTVAFAGALSQRFKCHSGREQLLRADG